MTKIPYLLPVLVGAFCAANANSEIPRTLILQHESEDGILSNIVDPIELRGTVVIRSEDGSVVAEVVDPAACQVSDETGLDCEDVEVGDSNFSVSPSLTVAEGTTLEFSWGSQGAWSCEPSGTLETWNARGELPADSRLATNQQRRVSTTGLASESAYSVILDCRNGPVNHREELSISVEESTTVPDGLPEQCGDPERSLDQSQWTRMTTGQQSCRYEAGWINSADCSDWGGLWPTSPFWSSSGLTRVLATGRSSAYEYISIEFDTTGMSPSQSGTIRVNDAGPGVETKRALLTISECPGDFDKDAITAETGCYRIPPSIQPTMSWRGPDNAGTTSCVVQPGRRYFLNIMYTPSEDGTAPSDLEPFPECGDGGVRCGRLVNP